MRDKASDYAPDDIAMWDACHTAADLNIRLEQVLWVHLKKHMTAIRRYMKDGHVASESIHERLRDAANFLALIDMAITCRDALLIAVHEYNEQTPSPYQDEMRRWLQPQLGVFGANQTTTEI